MLRRWRLIGIGVIGLAAVLARADELNQAAPAAIETRTQKWEFGIAVRAVAGSCHSIIGTFPVPSEWPEQQVKVASEAVTSNVRSSYRTLDGLRQVVFEVGQVPSGGEAECFITFEITKRTQVPPPDHATLIIPKEPPRDIKKYLNSSPLVESTNAKVRALARELPAGKETAWEQVQAIVDGVRERVKFELDTKDKMKGAIGALRDGQADREDLTATFVAVCRAAKIPCRMVWAMDYCYAEFYLEEPEREAASESEPAAKSKKTAKPAPPRGAWYPCVVHEPAELGSCSDLRPILEKGDNFKVPEEKPVQRFIKEFLAVKGAVKPSVEFRRRNAD